MAGLTKQHFKAIAEILRRQNIDLSKLNSEYQKQTITAYQGMEMKQTGIRQIMEDIADYFATQNPLFNKYQFLKACLE